MSASIETRRESIEEAETRARAARDRGVEWLIAHIGSNGEPVGARERNGWSRVPWALAVCG
jgi:hypothetical protein